MNIILFFFGHFFPPLGVPLTDCVVHFVLSFVMKYKCGVCNIHEETRWVGKNIFFVCVCVLAGTQYMRNKRIIIITP